MLTYAANARVLAFRGLHVTCEAFAGHHQIFIQRIVNVIGSGLGFDMSGGGRVHLDFVERTIAAQDREATMEVGEILLPGHERKVADHEIRCEKRVTACPIALRRASQIEIGFFQELAFQIKSSLIDLFIFVRQQVHRAGTGPSSHEGSDSL